MIRSSVQFSHLQFSRLAVNLCENRWYSFHFQHDCHYCEKISMHWGFTCAQPPLVLNSIKLYFNFPPLKGTHKLYIWMCLMSNICMLMTCPTLWRFVTNMSGGPVACVQIYCNIFQGTHIQNAGGSHHDRHTHNKCVTTL